MAITAKKQTAHIDSLTDNWMIVDLHRAFDTNECDLPLFFETIEAETIGLEEELGDHSFVEYEGKKLLLVAASEGKCNLVPRRIARGGIEAISTDEFEAVIAAIDGWLVAVLVPIDESNSTPKISFGFIRKKKWLRAGSPKLIDVTDKPAKSTATVAIKVADVQKRSGV